MSFTRYESERAVADAAARAHRQIDLDATEWHWEDAAEDRRLDRDPVATSCLVSALVLSVLVLAPAIETIAQHMH